MGASGVRAEAVFPEADSHQTVLRPVLLETATPTATPTPTPTPTPTGTLTPTPASTPGVSCPDAASGTSDSSVITGCLLRNNLPAHEAQVFGGWVGGDGKIHVTGELRLNGIGGFAFRIFATGTNIPGFWGIKVRWIRPGTTQTLEEDIIRQVTAANLTLNLGILDLEEDVFPLPTPRATSTPRPTPTITPTPTLAPTPTPLPEEGFFYVVQPGDWLVKLARRFYGDARLWRLIFDANPDVICTCPNRIKPGMRLFIPPPESFVQVKAANQGLIYTVQRGDTLFGLARRFYGDPSKWRVILEANKSVILPAGGLRPGMQLFIPPLTSPQVVLSQHPIIIPVTPTRAATATPSPSP